MKWNTDIEINAYGYIGMTCLLASVWVPDPWGHKIFLTGLIFFGISFMCYFAYKKQ